MSAQTVLPLPADQDVQRDPGASQTPSGVDSLSAKSKIALYNSARAGNIHKPQAPTQGVPILHSHAQAGMGRVLYGGLAYSRLGYVVPDGR